MPTISNNKDIVLEVSNLEKVYTIYKEKQKKKIFALKNITFNVHKGEVVSIIGPNGSGKSTLLKIISEVTAPTNGNVTIYGKVASILEVGIGFNMELSGRDNIYLNAQLYGMRKQEVDEKFDSIVQFFGFKDFINTPVKQYSSGMYMRLAFALIIHIEADIYLFDEVLSVGDDQFRRAVINVLYNLKAKGKSIIFVTHNPVELINVSDVVLLFNEGKIVKRESADNTIIDLLQFYKLTENNNIHTHDEKINPKVQYIQKDYLNKIMPNKLELKIIDDTVYFEYSCIIKDLYEDLKPKHFLVIKDSFSNSLAQHEFSDIKIDKDYCSISLSLPLNLFGPYLFYFDLICFINDEFVYMLPKVLSNVFKNDNPLTGVLNLNYL